MEYHLEYILNIFQIFHERALDVRWYIANEARSAELALTISYSTSVSKITVLLKTSKELPQNGLQTLRKRCPRQTN